MERKVPGDVGRAKHAGYDNTEEVEPKSSSVYCLDLIKIKWGTFSRFDEKGRLRGNILTLRCHRFDSYISSFH